MLVKLLLVVPTCITVLRQALTDMQCPGWVLNLQCFKHSCRDGRVPGISDRLSVPKMKQGPWRLLIGSGLRVWKPNAARLAPCFCHWLTYQIGGEGTTFWSLQRFESSGTTNQQCPKQISVMVRLYALVWGGSCDYLQGLTGRSNLYIAIAR